MDGRFFENTVRWQSPVDAPTASMMELQRLSCDLAHKAGRAEFDVLATAVLTKAGQTEVAELRAAVACLAKDVQSKAQLCDVERLRDNQAVITSNLHTNYATVLQLQAVGTQTAQINSIATVNSAQMQSLSKRLDEMACAPCIDPRLSQLARTLWALICQARDAKAQSDAQIAAVADPTTKLALTTLSTTLFDLIFSILGAFGAMKGEGGCASA